ncbi:MAG: hypothetical protein FJ147_05235 [Deltaproteobacteria bacterium]|nr:hypothetical protein [Deltaproteobacteria bacterium]
MKRSYRWSGGILGVVLLVSGGCTVQQQQEVLAGVGTMIPGSKNSLVYPESPNTPPQSSGSPSATPTSASSTQTAAASPPPAPPPAPRNDLGQTDAQLVLQTMQRAMKDNPTPFIECLDNTPCRSAFTTHLIRLQKLAGGTLELPPVYDRYDLQRGKE